jgi:hypothetical protein
MVYRLAHKYASSQRIHFGTRVKCYYDDEQGALRSLLAGRRFKSDYQFSGYPSAVFYLDAARLGPLPALGGVHSARRGRHGQTDQARH